MLYELLMYVGAFFIVCTLFMGLIYGCNMLCFKLEELDQKRELDIEKLNRFGSDAYDAAVEMCGLEEKNELLESQSIEIKERALARSLTIDDVTVLLTFGQSSIMAKDKLGCIGVSNAAYRLGLYKTLVYLCESNKIKDLD